MAKLNLFNIKRPIFSTTEVKFEELGVVFKLKPLDAVSYLSSTQLKADMEDLYSEYEFPVNDANVRFKDLTDEMKNLAVTMYVMQDDSMGQDAYNIEELCVLPFVYPEVWADLVKAIDDINKAGPLGKFYTGVTEKMQDSRQLKPLPSKTEDTLNLTGE